MTSCLKREVCAIIIDETGKIAVGQNLIYPETDITECPRLPGENYDKCISICHQKGHAETEAIREAKKRNMKLKNAKLYLIGHYRVCDNCKNACNKVGIKIIIVNKDKNQPRRWDV